MLHKSFLFTIFSINYLRCTFATITVYNQWNQTVELMDDYSARFGPRLPSEGLKGYIMVAKPKNACTPIASPPNISFVNKWIALIQRTPSYNGNCSFDLKVYNAQKAGFAAAIVYNSDSDRLVKMSSSGQYFIKIPSVFIGAYDGAELAYFYTYENKSYVLITDDDYNISIYLIPFAVIVGACFIIMVSVFIIKCAIYYHKSRKNRLSRSALKKLPVKKYQKTDKYDTCPICLDEYEEGVKLRILPCEHVYHIKCIDEWLLKNNRSCPVCKRRVLPGDDSDDETSSTNDERQPLTQSTNDSLNQNEQNNDDNDDNERSRLINPQTNSISNRLPNTTTTIITLITSPVHSTTVPTITTTSTATSTFINDSQGSNNSTQYGSTLSTQVKDVKNEELNLQSTSPNQINLNQNSLKFTKNLKDISKKQLKNDINAPSVFLKSSDDDEDDDQLLEEIFDNNEQAALLPIVQISNNATNSSGFTRNKKNKTKDENFVNTL